MIQVDFIERESEEVKTFILSVEGHANYEEHGKDIVCAGVSSLAQALCAFVMNSDCMFSLEENATGGMIYLQVENPDDRVRAAIEMAFIGMLQIEMAYPDYMTITRKQPRKH